MVWNRNQPLEGGGKNYIIYAGDDAVVRLQLPMTATLKEMKVVARADLNDNALNGNFFGSSQYGTGMCTDYGDITATTDNPATITTTIHLKDDLYRYLPGIHGNATSRLLTMRPI